MVTIWLIIMHDAPQGLPWGNSAKGSSWFIVLMAVILAGHFDNSN